MFLVPGLGALRKQSYCTTNAMRIRGYFHSEGSGLEVYRFKLLNLCLERTI